MLRRPKIVVVGSSNMDLVVRTARMPEAGETIIGGNFSRVLGGKGANQAVTAARLGADVTFIARLGADAFGEQMEGAFREEGIRTDYLYVDEDLPTGTASIWVETKTGENRIIVDSGANAALSVDDAMAAREVIFSASVLVCQLETPIATVAAALQIAREGGVITLLNPAPACDLSPGILEMVDILTPNENEAVRLCGDNSLSPIQASRLLAAKAGCVVLTLGAEGALVIDGDQEFRLEGPRVENVVDTTAAGDCFTGALAVALAEGMSLPDAAAFANAAAGLCVTRVGAQTSLPDRAEVEAFLAR